MTDDGERVQKESERKSFFTSTVMKAYADEAVRAFESANSKLDKLAGIMMQVALALAGLCATRIYTASAVDLPYTFLAIIFLGASMLFGSLQIIIDHFHFMKEGEICRNITSTCFSLLFNPIDENAKNLNSALEEMGRLNRKSNLYALYTQISLIIISVIFVVIELKKR